MSSSYRVLKLQSGEEIIAKIKGKKRREDYSRKSHGFCHTT